MEEKVATAKKFNIPLYYVEINHICYEKGIDWFYSYYGDEEAK